MRAAKIDLNQPAIVDALRKVGVSVVSLASVGNGIPDLLAAKNDKVWLIEVKGPKGKLTPAQVEFMSTWPGVVHIVRNVDDALRLVGVQA
jgi:hypothetical protein